MAELLVFVPLFIILPSIAWYRVRVGSFPVSLSATSLYGKFGGYVFGIGCAIMAACSWLACADMVQDELLWLAWLSTASLLFVAANPLKEGVDDTIHMVAAWVSGIAMTVLSCLISPTSSWVWVLLFGYVFFSRRKCVVLVAELCAVLQFVLSLFLR